jgi:YD repeat-containing protein
MRKNKIIIGALLLCYSASLALQGGATQPDYAQFEPSTTQDLVGLQSGDFTYSLPLGELPGPFGNYPLSISYHAGISPQAEATWVGLGWTLNPGVISRDIRGVPDDQFHGGTLGFIYQYSAMQTWSVNLGFSNGVISVGQSFSSDGTVGFSASVGPKLEGVAGVGFTVGTDAIGLDARIGNDYVSLNSSLMFSTTTGKASASIGADLGYKGASLGAQVSTGSGVSGNVGFGNSKNNVGLSVSSNGVSGSVKRNGIKSSISMSKNGASVSVGGGTLSVSNSMTKGKNKTSSVGFAIIVPTYIGVFSFGFSQALHEYWMRAATSDHLYGYIYQAGPAVDVKNKNDIEGMPSAKVESYTASGSIPWTWNAKGRNLEVIGNDDMSPAYDMYSVSSEGVSGSFRPFTRGVHNLYKKISNQKTNEKKSIETYTPILLDSLDDWPYQNDFSLTREKELRKTRFLDYNYCIEDDTCSIYGVYATNFRNESNRLLFNSDENQDELRGGMSFLFVGDAGGYYESLSLRESATESREKISSRLLRRTVNDFQYALYGSRKVEPIFENNSPVGKLQGFIVTTADGYKYSFQQPVKSYLKVDYSINQEKGVPFFVDKKGDKADGFWSNFLEGMIDFYSWMFKRLLPWENVMDLYDFIFKKGTLEEKCKINDDSKTDDYFYSYQVNMNPHATQWLLTEIQGADFVHLGNSIEENVGYNVKFSYTEPSIYRWRTPYARPELSSLDLPNMRSPRNGYTPEGCDSRMYQASFGVKEYVYLKSIETATHRVDFKLNEKERVDGKGWDYFADSGRVPIFVETSIGFSLSTTDSIDTVLNIYNNSLSGDDPIMDDTTIIGYGQAVYLKPSYLYVNSSIPNALIENLKKGVEIDVLGLKDTIMHFENFKEVLPVYYDSLIYNFSLNGIKVKAIKVKINQNAVLEQTTGEEVKYGLYRIALAPADSFRSDLFFTNKEKAENFNVKDSLVIFGTNGNQKMTPYLDWSGIVFAENDADVTENRMRYLEKISYYNKQESSPYREFIFDYDYSLQPKTLNSYCTGRYPESVAQIKNSPDSVGINVCDSDSANGLYGKLTLKAITENGCQYGRCASLPPFHFSYLAPSLSSTRISDDDAWIEYSQGIKLTEDNIELSQFPKEYYEKFTDLDATILASSNTVDEWGFWSENANLENHKTDQYFADYGASAWSLNQITDPAGGVLEVEYERDIYKDGEDHAADKRFIEFVTFGPCSKYKNNFSIAENNNDKVCLVLGDLYWREQCLGPRAAFWDTIRPAGNVGNGFEYLDSIGILDSTNNLAKSQTFYFNLMSQIGTTVSCGMFGLADCDRTRSVALFGDAQLIDMVTGSDPERRLLILDRDWFTVDIGLKRAAKKINEEQNWSLENTGRWGYLWSKKEYAEMKGGDLRVSHLTRHDMGTVSTTSYEYDPGEIAQLPDSAYTTVLGNRFYGNKISFALPDVDLKPISRIVGFNDDDLNFVPGPRITYPKVTVKNTNNALDALNGSTEFFYITPETGIPAEYVDEELKKELLPFLKLNLKLFKLYNNEQKQLDGVEYYDKRFRGRLIEVSLLDQNHQRLNATSPLIIQIYEDKPTSITFYSESIKDAKYIKVKNYLLDMPIEDKSLDSIYEIKDNLSDFNEMMLSLTSKGIEKAIGIDHVWFRKQKEGYIPILYRKANYRQTIITIPGLIDEDDEKRNSLIKDIHYESEVNYYDLTSFLGLNYKVVFNRGQENSKIPIKIDSSIYSTKVPDVLAGVVDGDQKDSLYKIGRQVERWSSQQEIQCDDERSEDQRENYRAPVCEKQYRHLYFLNNKIEDKMTNYYRIPAFQIGSINYVGHDNQSNSINTSLLGKTSLENHRFDPLTGSPTATVAKSSLGNGREVRKITQKTPHYMLSGDTSLSNEMFRRNMLSQNFFEELYSGTFAVTDPWDTYSIDSLRSVSISPYRFMPDTLFPSSISKLPIVAWGTYTSKKTPSELSKTNDFFSYQNAEKKLPSLLDYNGTHIRKINNGYKVLESEDVWGRSLSTVYSSDGMNQVGLFFPATLSEVALVVPNQKQIAKTDNCTITGNYSADARSGITAKASTTISCSVTSLKPETYFLSEYRYQKNGKWLVKRELLSVPVFNLSLSADEKLNYLRIYPGDAESKTYIYDLYSNLIQLISEDNTSTYFEYDSFGKLIQSRDDDGISYKAHHREYRNNSSDEIQVLGEE